MRSGVIAKKVGMTRVFTDAGEHVPVTVLQMDGCQVVAHRTKDKNGYTALQLGLGRAKPNNVPKAERERFARAKVEQNVRAGLEVAHVGGKTQRMVGFDRVLALVLQRVSADLVQQADTTPFIEHVDDDAAALAFDLRHRRFELFSAVAAFGAEHIAGQALRMQAREHRRVRVDFALDHGDDRRGFQIVAIDHETPAAAVARRQYRFRFAADLALVRAFTFAGTQRIEARAEAFNAFNWFRWGNPITALNNANFGRILSADDPRIMQFAVKYSF
mgnify:CR=1 FL=1